MLFQDRNQSIKAVSEFLFKQFRQINNLRAFWLCMNSFNLLSGIRNSLFSFRTLLFHIPIFLSDWRIIAIHKHLAQFLGRLPVVFQTQIRKDRLLATLIQNGTVDIFRWNMLSRTQEYHVHFLKDFPVSLCRQAVINQPFHQFAKLGLLDPFDNLDNDGNDTYHTNNCSDDKFRAHVAISLIYCILLQIFPEHNLKHPTWRRPFLCHPNLHK